MPKVTFGGKRGTAVELVTDPELVAVRTHSRRSFRAGPVPRPEAALLEQAELVMSVPEAGVEVYRRKPGARRSMADVRHELKKSPDTRFAGRVLVEKTSRRPVLYTENLFVKFKDDVEPDRCLTILQEAGLTVKEEVGYAANAWFVTAPEGTGQEVFDIAQKLLARPEVEVCHPELIRPIGRRRIAPNQWHLKPTVIAGQTINASANVERAHAITRGEGITIAIIDDGFDLDHEEFASPGKVIAPRDLRSPQIDDDPRPGHDDDHGTACAGVACADGREGASGVAPAARLVPIRMPMAIGSQRIADAFRWAADHGADVISCSWGPEDGRWWDANDPLHRTDAPLPDNIRLAIDYAVSSGRGGKGCVVCFAAGNGNESVDLDGYARYEKVIAVAACNDRGRRSVYSDFGKAVFCAFPSSDFEFAQEDRPAPLTPGIWTTDRSGRAGYNFGSVHEGDVEGDYTATFGGTSSACPGAAGVAALVLSRNPALRWEQVRDVLRRACDRIDPQNGRYDAKGHSPLYGYGRLNAETAVTLALPPEATETMTVARTFNAPVRDLQTTRVELEVTDARAIASLSVQVEVEHTYIGDLVVSVVPPAATGVGKLKLHDRSGGGTNNLKRSYDAATTPVLAALASKVVRGTWALEVRDTAEIDVGVIRRFGLEVAFDGAERGVRSRAGKTGAAAAAGPARKRAGHKVRRAA